MTVAVGFVSV